MTKDNRSRGTNSDTPGTDLKTERDEFLRKFSRGTQLTEDFVKEHERMQGRLQDLESENAGLRAKVEADQAVRELLEKDRTPRKREERARFAVSAGRSGDDRIHCARARGGVGVRKSGQSVRRQQSAALEPLPARRHATDQGSAWRSSSAQSATRCTWSIRRGSS